MLGLVSINYDSNYQGKKRSSIVFQVSLNIGTREEWALLVLKKSLDCYCLFELLENRISHIKSAPLYDSSFLLFCTVKFSHVTILETPYLNPLIHHLHSHLMQMVTIVLNDHHTRMHHIFTVTVQFQQFCIAASNSIWAELESHFLKRCKNRES